MKKMILMPQAKLSFYTKCCVLWLSLLATSLSSYAQYNWAKLNAAPYNGAKQDDIFFINKDTGWSVNGSGYIYRTNDGGTTWTAQLHKPSTFFRCVGFVTDSLGFAGNIGTNYFPGVTDTVPLYRTTDGGITWQPITNYTGPRVKGLCAISIAKTPFINRGNLDHEVTIYAAGRVGSPAFLMKSTDRGQTWTSKDLSAYCAMITDVHFFNKDTGFVFGGTSGDIASSGAKILYTTNGGETFSAVYTSTRTYEMIWKASFPSRKTGYATVLSYDNGNPNRYVAKTTDGGLTWTEIPLTNSGRKEFGIGFITDSIGWVGTDANGYETTDGGTTWTNTTLGSYANKIRTIKTTGGFVAYAIGLNVYKLSTLNSGLGELKKSNSLVIYPNPNSAKELFIRFDNLGVNYTKIEVINLQGKVATPTPVRVDEKTTKIDLSGFAAGTYTVKIYENGKVYTEKLIIGEVRP